VWPRAGVMGHVSDSTPLVIPYWSDRARERTPGPKPNCTCTALRWPLLSPFSRPLGREFKLETRVYNWIPPAARSGRQPAMSVMLPGPIMVGVMYRSKPNGVADPSAGSLIMARYDNWPPLKSKDAADDYMNRNNRKKLS